MKPFVRNALTITATAAVSIATVVALFGSPFAVAQPAPAQPAAPAPTPPTSAPAGPGSQSGSASAATPESQGAQPGSTVTGTESTPPVTTPGMSGEGSAAGDGTGSAAPGAGSAAPGAGSAAAGEEPAKPKKPTIVPVNCATAQVTLSVKGTSGGFAKECVATTADACSVQQAFAAGTAVRFEPGADAIIPYPDDKTEFIQNLQAPANQVTCIRFDATGTYRFRAKSRPDEGTLLVKTWYELLGDHPIDEDGNFWMPKSVNIEADSTDQMFYALLGLSAFFFFAIAFVVVYFVWRYRARPGHKSQPSAAHNDALEITWTVIPTIICVFLFYYGWRTYVKVVTPPTKAVEVNVLAYRWSWQFTHANGTKDKDLHVPVNTPVRLVMTSKDVLHAFYAPVMRVKQDIIPRRYTYAWFFATKPGTYRLTCAEYCGTDHSQMGINPDGRRAVVVVHEPGKYEQYLADEYARANNLPPPQLGAKVFEKNCTACHTADGSAKIGPTFKAAFGKMVPLADGSKVAMDENYIQESILNPNAKTHAGYPAGTMPSFEGQLKEKEIEGLIAFIKSLK